MNRLAIQYPLPIQRSFRVSRSESQRKGNTIPEATTPAVNRANRFCYDPGLLKSSEITPIVFVIDNDLSVRESLELLFRSQGWRPETFGSAQEFLARPRVNAPCCVIFDVSLPDVNGLELQKQIARERPEMPIILATSCGDVAITVQAMKAGAVEFLTKPLSNDALLGAIRESLERSRIALNREIEISDLRNCYASLTLRERQVMALVVSGLLNKQVGAELGISEITVKAHRGQVMQKMKAISLPDLVRMTERLRRERPVTLSSSFQSVA
jgi:FixJ family two-component response regulator